MKIRREEWGPLAWKLIHSAAYLADRSAPEDNARIIVPRLLYRFEKFLPCQECATHYRELVLSYPPPSPSSKASLFQYTIELHNRVNERLGKMKYDVNDGGGGGEEENVVLYTSVDLTFIRYLYDQRVFPIAANAWQQISLFQRSLALMR